MNNPLATLIYFLATHGIALPASTLELLCPFLTEWEREWSQYSDDADATRTHITALVYDVAKAFVTSKGQLAATSDTADWHDNQCSLWAMIASASVHHTEPAAEEEPLYV